MIRKIQYSSIQEREKILDDNSNLTLIEEMNIIDGNFLIFTDEITIKNEEIELLKTRLKYTEDALLFLMDMQMIGGL